MKTARPMRTIIVWDSKSNYQELCETYKSDSRFNIVKTYHYLDVLDNYESTLKDIEYVIVVGVHSHPRNKILKYCITNNIKMFITPRVGDIVMGGAKQVHTLGFPMSFVEWYSPSPSYAVLKRFFDIVTSVLMLAVASPLMLVIALLIRRDGGTVLYKQTRLTKNGKEFKLLKFRSMKMDAESDGIARLSSGDNDDRVTPIGRFIRKHRIDKLPQLINILKGDMSVVGPRPERPEMSTQY